GSARARLSAELWRAPRLSSEARRGDHCHSADALAMAWALEPEGALETAERPVAVETEGRLTRRLTAVDWNRQTGAPDNARILLRYDQARFDARVKAALAAG